MQPWFTVYFDIGHPWPHPCYDQLTLVKARYPLTSITWPYSGLKFTAHRGRVFFEVDRWTSAAFSIGSRAHIWLTCRKQYKIVRNPVDAKPGFKVNWIITFFLYKCYCCFVLCIWWLYSNHPETIIKFFVTNLNKHKHSIRSGHLVYWYRNTASVTSSKGKKQRRINSKGKYLHHHHYHLYHYLHHKENTAVKKKIKQS